MSGSSLAFRQTLEHIYEVLLDLPEIGTARNFHNPEMKGLRMLPVRKFTKYLIFYRSTLEGLEIVLLHLGDVGLIGQRYAKRVGLNIEGFGAHSLFTGASRWPS